MASDTTTAAPWVDGPEYRLGSDPIDPHTAAGQALLEEAYRTHQRPRCECTPDGVPMYLSRVGARLIVKRMPDTGAAHAPACPSYAPEDLSGIGHVLGSAVRVDPASGQAVLRLGFRLSMGERAAPESNDATTPPGSVSSPGQRLSLRAVLDYLWHEADLVAWSPGMAGKRHWGVVSWHLRQAAQTARAKGHPLAERLYLPEPFRLERKAELAARRLAAWQGAAPRPGRVQQLMILIGEVKAIEPARYGHKLVVKHLPDAPLFLDGDLHRRMLRRFARELDMWTADEASHLIIGATFTVGRGGSATAQEVALMPTTSTWLPYDDPYSKLLLESLVDRHRRFRACPRFALSPTVQLPTAILTDTVAATPLHIGAGEPPTPEDTSPEPSQPWTWNTAEQLPPLPPAWR